MGVSSLDLEQLLRTLKAAFDPSIGRLKVDPLPGDASSRAYYRLFWEAKGSERRCILMVMDDPEGARGSEEVQGGPADNIQELPFVNIQRHLLSCKIAVPKIFHHEEAPGWLFLEDLGDQSFAEEVRKSLHNGAALLDCYKGAIDVLLAIQKEATPEPFRSTIAHQRRFDAALFSWEFEHFVAYGIEARNGRALPHEKKKALKGIFSDIAGRLAALPKVFVHRDYHARNLMVQDGPNGRRIRVIDFQDALMGPMHYDLASLLRDAYIDLPEDIVDALLAYYIERWTLCSGEVINRSVFRESFDLISLQRNLKAAGRFVYINQVKGKPHLLKYVASALVKAGKNLRKYSQLHRLHALLADEVEELR